jgi:DNA-binding FadR family transcriptional regulator
MFLYRVQSLREPSEAINALKGHRVIFERIRDRDEAGAVTAINEHLDFVQTNVREYTSGMIGAARR